MTGAQALNLVMARLGNRVNATLRANLLVEMNQIQSQSLEQGQLLYWFLVTEKTDLALVVGERTLDVPDDFLRELDEESLIEIQDTNGKWKRMRKRTYETNRAHFGDSDTGDLPRDYSLVGSQLMIFPLPLVACPVRLRYYGSQPAVADTADVPTNKWLLEASDLLIAETCVIAASAHIQIDGNKVMEYQAFVTKAQTRLSRAETARAEANLNRTMG